MTKKWKLIHGHRECLYKDEKGRRKNSNSENNYDKSLNLQCGAFFLFSNSLFTVFYTLPFCFLLPVDKRASRREKLWWNFKILIRKPSEILIYLFSYSAFQSLSISLTVTYKSNKQIVFKCRLFPSHHQQLLSAVGETESYVRNIQFKGRLLKWFWKFKIMLKWSLMLMNCFHDNLKENFLNGNCYNLDLQCLRFRSFKVCRC